MNNLTKVKRKGKIIKFGYKWGDNIEIGKEIKEGHYRVSGWKTLDDFSRVQVGDILSLPVENDGRGYFVINKCENMGDPKDMFFADIQFVIGISKDVEPFTEYIDIYNEIKNNDIFGVLGSLNPDGELMVEDKNKGSMNQYERSTRDTYQYIVGYEKTVDKKEEKCENTSCGCGCK